MWNINLKWEEDEVYFDREWNYFAKNIRLSVGDICLFLNTSHPQRFQIAIFEKATVCNLYRAGCSSRKGLLKFYKVMSYENIYSGEMEVPRLFLNEFGEVKGGNIKLFLADGCQFSGYVCESSHVMIGLKDILGKYSVKEHYVLFFDYVGSSTFYVSIYNTLGMNIFNKMEEKLLVEELVKQVQFFSQGMIERDVGDAAGVRVVGVQISDVPLNYFIVDLKKCNVAQTGHGVYFARHLFSIYRTWRNGTILNVIHDEQTWRVAVHRKKKMCRFGRGWDQFAKASKLKEGQKLKFCHVSDETFAVTSV
ncbi:hypothetical protein POM88_008732 [Heracleum sosnowskyi]|uniref:TF-B3 domain-containing protein n=1 Tax=Heracleum sosnowskyi TaxID=360622 RepID=A0AAD8N6S3_9APIA|nr:hypothetical protein POM88_008732 [Heracleum sosnowskyi]